MKRSRKRSRVAAAALVPEIAIGLTALPADAAPPPTDLVSQWETSHPGCDISGDGGLSALLPPEAGQPTRSIWLRGDTGMIPLPCSGQAGAWGTPAAISVNGAAGDVPVVSELPAAGQNGLPGTPIGALPNGTRPVTRFLPRPTGLVRGDTGAACPEIHRIEWPQGVTRGPAGAMTLYYDGTPVQVADASKLMFISYAERCQIDLNHSWTERIGMVAWNPATNSIVAHWTVWDGLTDDDPSSVEVKWHQGLGSLTFRGGYLYVVVSNCAISWPGWCPGTDPGDKTVLRRVPQADIHDKTKYKFWNATPAHWTGDYTQASTILPGEPGAGPYTPPQMCDFSASGDGYVIFETIAEWGEYRIWQSSHPEGPWTLSRDRTIPPETVLNVSRTRTPGCHPELSTPSNLIYSFFDSADEEINVVSVGSLP